MHGHHPETHNYRPACARTGLAAPRRPSLVIQKIHRLGVGGANNWLGRAMDENPRAPRGTKMVAAWKGDTLAVDDSRVDSPGRPQVSVDRIPWEQHAILLEEIAAVVT
jgi:hypothetical protein